MQVLHNRLVDAFACATNDKLHDAAAAANLDELSEFIDGWSAVLKFAREGDIESTRGALQAVHKLIITADKRPVPKDKSKSKYKRKFVRVSQLNSKAAGK
jgi:hypothetical protein